MLKRSCVLVGAVASMLAASCTGVQPHPASSPLTSPPASHPGDPSVAAASSPPPSPPPNPSSTPMLVWIPQGLPAGFASSVGRLPGVKQEVPVVSGTVWMTGAYAANGKVASAPPPGFRIPIELAGADPRAFSNFMPAADQRYVPALSQGRGIIGTIESKIRGFGAGGHMRFGGNSVQVAGVVPDADIGMHELFVSLDEARKLGVTKQRYMLVQKEPGASWASIGHAIRRLLPRSTLMAIRTPAQVTYLRQADSVIAPVQEKQYFGEFSANPDPSRPTWLILDPAWIHRYLATESVPILGRITCNRYLFPQLRHALGGIARAGLARLIHTNDYGGCFAPRVIPGDVGQAIAHHTWGTAIDINVSQNPWGGTPHQDPRVVAIFQRWGFTWGGNWMFPDGMHFEFYDFPPGFRG